MELEITLIIAAVMIAIYAISFICIFIGIKNSPKLNPDELDCRVGFEPMEGNEPSAG